MVTMIFAFGMYESSGNISHSINEIKLKLWPSMIANWLFWPLFLFFIYAVIPRFFRSIADAAIATLWSIILSFVMH